MCCPGVGPTSQLPIILYPPHMDPTITCLNKAQHAATLIPTPLRNSSPETPAFQPVSKYNQWVYKYGDGIKHRLNDCQDQMDEADREFKISRAFPPLILTLYNEVSIPSSVYNHFIDLGFQVVPLHWSRG